MDRIDVLQDEYEGYKRLTKDLLAETNDEELQSIVLNAATELKSPMALVSLILDHIQFFKAHVGLPDLLATARGTHRDASFCQFVVRDGKTFEVNDGPNDTRIPQHVVKEWNIHSYLGIPIKVDGVVVGSLCVLDTKQRTFTKKERQRLEELALLVNKRLKEITKNRRQVWLDLTYSSFHPAVIEILDNITPIQEYLKAGYSHSAAIRTFLDLFELMYYRETTETAKMSFEAASKANQEIQEHFREIEIRVLDTVDCLDAMNSLISNSAQTKLSEIMISAQDLARNATKSVGGFPLPDFLSDPEIHTNSNLAIAIVSNLLLMLSTELRNISSTSGILLNIQEEKTFVRLIFSAKSLVEETFESISNQLIQIIGEEHPTISVDCKDSSIQLMFKTKIK